MSKLMFCKIVVLFVAFDLGRCFFVPRYNDTQRLSELNIAGTHDTMAFNTAIIWAQTQDLNLRAQLDSGIRFIDIRLRHFNDQLLLHHDRVYLQLSFGPDVLDVISQFFHDNPNEFVVMSIKSEWTEEGNTRDFHTQLEMELQSHAGDWWRGTSDNPTVGEIRHKFVVIQRFDGDRLGIPYNSFDTQDLYDSMITVKEDGITKQIEKALAAPSDQKFINFISSAFLVPYVPWFTPRTHADTLNPYTRDELLKTGDPQHRRVGIIVMDFAPDLIIRMLNEGVSG